MSLVSQEKETNLPLQMKQQPNLTARHHSTIEQMQTDDRHFSTFQQRPTEVSASARKSGTSKSKLQELDRSVNEMNKSVRDKKSFSSFLNNDRKKAGTNTVGTKDGGTDETKLGSSPVRRKGLQG